MVFFFAFPITTQERRTLKQRTHGMYMDRNQYHLQDNHSNHLESIGHFFLLRALYVLKEFHDHSSVRMQVPIKFLGFHTALGSVLICTLPDQRIWQWFFSWDPLAKLVSNKL